MTQYYAMQRVADLLGSEAIKILWNPMAQYCDSYPLIPSTAWQAAFNSTFSLHRDQVSGFRLPFSLPSHQPLAALRASHSQSSLVKKEKDIN
ncbi:hypothetical protein FKM82_002905 [Ascaphus truei]